MRSPALSPTCGVVSLTIAVFNSHCLLMNIAELISAVFIHWLLICVVLVISDSLRLRKQDLEEGK